MTSGLVDLVFDMRLDEATRGEKLARIRRAYTHPLRAPHRMPNFEHLLDIDLRQLFNFYDEVFFEHEIRNELDDRPLEFRVSSRMTRRAAKTVQWVNRRTGTERYEIVISRVLLAGVCVETDSKPLKVNGIECRDRLDVLMRILEHEIIHLIEFALWGESSCSSAPYQMMAGGIFGHTEFRHRLPGPEQLAAKKHGIRPGTMVEFEYDGELLVGVVNRITRRATVLVESDEGQPYDDGKSYIKFYIPLQFLRPVGQTAS